MLGYVLRRLGQTVLVLFAVTVITFIMISAVAGDGARRDLGKSATEERIREYHHREGTDRPIYVQYGAFLNRLRQLDFGMSSANKRPVWEMMLEVLPYTIQLAIFGLLIELFGIPLGIYSALRQFTFWDTALTMMSLLLWSMPVFLLGFFLQWLIGVKLDLLPVGGVAPGDFHIIPRSWEEMSYLILPALTIGLIEVAYISYMQRASMLEVVRTDYIRTARAKGLSERTVILKHGLRNAVIPVITIAGIDLGALLGGAIITEVVFSRPGIGQMIYRAIGERDTKVIVAGVMFSTVVYVLANLLVDLAYAWADPRIRLDE